jgi:hypothetical protein
VDTAARLKSIVAVEAAEISGCTPTAIAADVRPLSEVAVIGAVVGSVTVSTSPVAAKAIPAFCPTPLDAAN